MTPERDLFRDTYVRYLGYANEVGESFRSFIGSKWVLATYGIATAYVLADTVHKTKTTYDAAKLETGRAKKTIYAAADTLAWQMLASVFVPGFTINRVCALSAYVLGKNGRLPKDVRKWTVTAIGLATVPFIIKPIDRAVDVVLDNSLRKFKP